jgi:hypothetical protein
MKVNKSSKIFILLGILVGVVILLSSFWWFLSYSRLSYEKRAWLDDLITGISIRTRAIPVYLLPYPRYEVMNKDGESYYYAFVESFTTSNEETSLGPIKDTKSSVLNLKTIGGENKNLDFWNQDINFLFRSDGVGLFVGEANKISEGNYQISGVVKSLVTQEPLFLRATSYKANVREGDLVKVYVDKNKKVSIFWLGSRNIFY